MPFDVESFIREAGLQGQDAEDARRIAKSNAKFGDGWMRQDEFDRKFNDSKSTLKTAQDALDLRRQEMDAEYGALAKWKGDSEGELSRAKTAVTEAEARVKAAEDAVTRAAQDAGRDPKDYLTAAAARRDEPRSPAVDTSRFVDADALAKATLGQMAVSEALYHIGENHRQLFGTALPSDANLTGEWTAAMKRGEQVTLADVYEKKFNVGAKRAEIAEVSRKREVQEAVDAAITKERSEAALRGGRGFDTGDGRPQSPVLAESFERTAQRRPGAHGLDAAVSTFVTEQNRIRSLQAGR